jgi:hypothetical protein
MTIVDSLVCSYETRRQDLQDSDTRLYAYSVPTLDTHVSNPAEHHTADMQWYASMSARR